MAWCEYFKMFWAQQPHTAVLSLIPYCNYLKSNTVNAIKYAWDNRFRPSRANN